MGDIPEWDRGALALSNSKRGMLSKRKISNGEFSLDNTPSGGESEDGKILNGSMGNKMRRTSDEFKDSESDDVKESPVARSEEPPKSPVVGRLKISKF